MATTIDKSMIMTQAWINARQIRHSVQTWREALRVGLRLAWEQCRDAAWLALRALDAQIVAAIRGHRGAPAGTPLPAILVSREPRGVVNWTAALD